MPWLIYRHISPSGKSYIGQTKRPPKMRFKYGKGYTKCCVFYNAIKKYGWKNFTTEILETGIETQEKANEREAYWIAYYHSLYYENGYNMSKGGACGIESLCKPVVQIDMRTLQKIQRFPGLTEAALATNTDRAQISKCCYKAKKHISANGYYWCWEADYSDIWQPREPYIPNHENSYVGVVQIEVSTLQVVGKYSSISAASAATGILGCNISKAIDFENYKTTGGYYWVQESEYYEGWVPPLYRKNRGILCLNKDTLTVIQKYNNVYELCDKWGKKALLIKRCLNRWAPTAYGYCWCYEDEFNNEWQPLQAVTRKRFRPVLCVETQQRYASIKEAAQQVSGGYSETGTRGGILRVCQGKAKTCLGYHWKFIEEEN